MYSKSRAARFGAVLIGALLLGFSSGAKALPMTELALVLDASGSIGAFDWNCSAPGSLDTSLSHAAGLIEIAACHA